MKPSKAPAGFGKIRVTTTSALGLSALCDAVWAKGLSGNKVEGDFKKRVVIKETADERWSYEQIRVPIVSDRDYVLYVKLERPASSGRCDVRFETRTDPASGEPRTDAPKPNPSISDEHDGQG